MQTVLPDKLPWGNALIVKEVEGFTPEPPAPGLAEPTEILYPEPVTIPGGITSYCVMSTDEPSMGRGAVELVNTIKVGKAKDPELLLK